MRPFITQIGWVVVSNDKTAFGGWMFDADWEPLGYDPAGYNTVYGYTLEELAEIAARHKEWGDSRVVAPMGIEEELGD